jgi:NitT/TauT family transport system ATP-binding protein
MQDNAIDWNIAIPKLEVKHISKSYALKGGHNSLILDDIDLQLAPREFTCLVGTSGCGKSTLLNIIAGLLQPSSGEILVDGRSVTGQPGSDRGMIFQGYTLYPWLTVAKNVAFGLQFQQLTKAEQRDRVHYFLDVVGLLDFAHSYPKQLSGGMKQRVAIARALANQPAVILMDEPFGALDAQTKEQMQEFLLELWTKTHVSILMITHDIEEAIYLSQRIYVLSARPGRVRSAVTIPLPEHRKLDLKLAPEFVEIKRNVIHLLRE